MYELCYFVIGMGLGRLSVFPIGKMIGEVVEWAEQVLKVNMPQGRIFKTSIKIMYLKCVWSYSLAYREKRNYKLGSKRLYNITCK